jgi:hypothetical protein
MIPHKFTPFSSTETLYYSLNKDDFLFKPNQISNLSKLSREIQTAFTDTCYEIGLSNIAQNTLLYKCTSNVELDINHRWSLNADERGFESLPFCKDPNTQVQKTIELDLPINSQFLSGCFSLRYMHQYDAHRK